MPPKSSILSLLLLNVWIALPANAGNDPVPPAVRVSQVTFSQGTALTNDDGSPMPVPQWVDAVNDSDQSDDFPDGNPDPVQGGTKPNHVKSYAYSYVSIKKPTVGAVFKWKNNAPPPGGPFKASGVVLNTPNCRFTLPERELVFDSVYPSTESPENIVHERRIQGYVTGNRKVKRSDGTTDFSNGVVPLTILWTVRNSSNIVIGQSESTHTIYVTWDEPIAAEHRGDEAAALNGSEETLFNLSCVMANGTVGGSFTANQGVCNKIYGDFKDKEVQRMDGEVLQFWGVGGPGTILQSKTARCGGWASFFSSVLSVHGYGSSIVDVDAQAVTLPNGVTPSSGLTVWYVKGHIVTSESLFSNGNVEVRPTGIARGQGGTCTADSWNSHAIAKAFDDYYDPSYGIGSSSNEIAYEYIATPGFRYIGPDWATGKQTYKYVENSGSKLTKTLNYK